MKTLIYILVFNCFLAIHVVNAAETQWVDLIGSVDPVKHAVKGEWSKTDNGLTVNADTSARIQLPTAIQGDYDAEINFTRTSGIHSVAFFFIVNGQQVGIDIDAWGQHLAGMQLIDDQDIKSNQTRVEGVRLDNNRQYTLELSVRGSQVTVKLDSELMFQTDTDGHKLSLVDLWALPDTNSFGVGAYDSATTFHAIKIRAIETKGKTDELAVGKDESTPDLEPGKETSKVKSKDDLAILSDEFENKATIKDWKRVFKEESTRADQLEFIGLDKEKQALVLMPYTSSWYEDYRGVLVFKPVTGNFIVTTHVQATGRNSNNPPSRQYSLAGIMVRQPRNEGPDTWAPGNENYIFLSIGSANQPGTSQFEVKTTLNSDSKLEISSASTTEAEIKIARVGDYFILFKREPGRGWNVHKRYYRPDMPKTLQVGMTVYTDWKNVERLSPREHNYQVIRNGSPDLRASFNYFRFRRPDIPDNIATENLLDAGKIQDKELLELLR